MIHHLAIAPKNFERSHAFYTEVMGFKVVHAVKRQAMGGPDVGWTKHVFYDSGKGGLFALWDLHLKQLDDDAWNAAISTGLGLPFWVNHFAFEVDSLEELEERKQRWLAHGLKVSEVEHSLIRSIYAWDPDRNLIEWTYQTRELTEADRIEAEEIVADNTPSDEADFEPVLHSPSDLPVEVVEAL
jgi:catechol 2,3-dioxygenase-like lactoylglutathione lyase family enzyme